jgi:hypothetical protein
MVYLTRFSFNSNKVGDTKCIQMTDSQLGFTKLSIILFWVVFALSIIYNLIILSQYYN